MLALIGSKLDLFKVKGNKSQEIFRYYSSLNPEFIIDRYLNDYCSLRCQ